MCLSCWPRVSCSLLITADELALTIAEEAYSTWQWTARAEKWSARSTSQRGSSIPHVGQRYRRIPRRYSAARNVHYSAAVNIAGYDFEDESIPEAVKDACRLQSLTLTRLAGKHIDLDGTSGEQPYCAGPLSSRLKTAHDRGITSTTQGTAKAEAENFAQRLSDCKRSWTLRPSLVDVPY